MEWRQLREQCGRCPRLRHTRRGCEGRWSTRSKLDTGGAYREASFPPWPRPPRTPPPPRPPPPPPRPPTPPPPRRFPTERNRAPRTRRDGGERTRPPTAPR